MFTGLCVGEMGGWEEGACTCELLPVSERPRSSDQRGGGTPSFITGGGSRKRGGRGRRPTPSPPYPYACAHISTTHVVFVFIDKLKKR